MLRQQRLFPEITSFTGPQVKRDRIRLRHDSAIFSGSIDLSRTQSLTEMFLDACFQATAAGCPCYRAGYNRYDLLFLYRAQSGT